MDMCGNKWIETPLINEVGENFQRAEVNPIKNEKNDGMVWTK